MNLSYGYKDMDLWREDKWLWRRSQIYPLAEWFSARQPVSQVPAFRKENAVALKERLEKQGLQIEDHFIGGRWLTLVPANSLGKKLTTLVVFHSEEAGDPDWTLKTLVLYQKYHEAILKDHAVVIHIVPESGKKVPEYWSIMMEATAMYPIDWQRTYLDISEVYAQGLKLAEIPGLELQTHNYRRIEDPDSRVEYYGSLEIPVLDISRRWQNRYGSNRPQVTGSDGRAGFDAETYIHSESAERQVKGLRLEYYYDSIHESGFRRYWLERGLEYEEHDLNGDRWIAVFPSGIPDSIHKKLPVLIMLQEVYYCNDHYPVEAFSYYYEYCKLAAQGEFVGIFWSAERPEDHEPLVEILKQAERRYHTDMTRVYITGHSHNGHYGYEFARMNPELITAVATMGNSCGLSATNHFALSREKLDQLEALDIPLVNLFGYNESAYRLLINRKGEFVPEEWMRRLKASGCPPCTEEEIKKAQQSGDYVTRKLGIPGDRTEVIYLDNREHYIMDIRNRAGRFHLRLIAADNAPHNPTPSLQRLGWSWLRRFSRDPDSGEIHDDYE